MIMIGKKSQIRMESSIKRKICKGCHGILIAGRSAEINIVGPSKEKAISICCDICLTEKRFLLKEKTNKKKKDTN